MFSDDTSKFVRYHVLNKRYTSIYSGLKSERKGYYHPFISYNNFVDKDKKIPAGAKKKSMTKEWVHKYYCGDKKELKDGDKVTDKVREKVGGFMYYLIHDNGGRPFVVYFDQLKGEGEAYIYKMEDDKYYWEDGIETWMYTKLVKRFEYEQIHVGESPLNDSTEFSGGHGDAFDGNSILFDIGKNKYIYVGSIVYQFKMLDGFQKYWSPVGNSDVPYPFIVGNKYVYMMLDKGYVDKDKFAIDVDENTDLYHNYYGHHENDRSKGLEKELICMKGFKMIEERQW